ncbi:MAG: tripartite tricarboxylate transporter TctB family protein [Pirellulaceae bacterium]|nr:tripartite tricarboxylate transporter TctB family protein [Pirellulaceae bacterium]
MPHRPLHLAWLGLLLASITAITPNSASSNNSVGTASADYPIKTVTIICPWAAGGGTDRIARFWADALNREFHRPFVVVNRVGGSGAIGHFAGAHAPRNGHTLTLVTFEIATMHRMRVSTLTHEDFECILQVNADPAAILVSRDAPWQSLSDWLNDVRANPGRLKMSGTATGGTWDLHRIGLMRAAGLDARAVVWVPYQGSSEALQQLMGKHLDLVCCSLAEAKNQLDSGEVRALTVMSAERLASHPQVPTAREQGIDWIAEGFRGLAVPKGTPVDFVRRLEEACLRIGHSDSYRQVMDKNGFGVTIRNAQDFRDFLRAQDEQWKDAIVSAGYDQGLSGNHDPGPLALPTVLIAGILLLSVVEVVRSRWANTLSPLNSASPTNVPVEPQPEQSRAGGGSRTLVIISLIVLYALALPWLGFIVSTCLFVITLTKWLGASWPGSVCAGLLLVGTVWLIFTGLFSVQLP